MTSARNYTLCTQCRSRETADPSGMCFDCRRSAPASPPSVNGAVLTPSPLPAGGEGEDDRVTAAPSNPMAVARHLIDDLNLVGLIRHWRGDFYKYGNGIWADIEDRWLREMIYSWLEPAKYIKKEDLVMWEPTSRKVNDVLDAFKAIAYLDRVIEPPAWLSNGSIPAEDTIVLANGLLHVPTRKLIGHTPAFWAHNRVPYGYNQDASQSARARWEAFLHDLWGDDQESIDTLQEVFGYIVGGDTRQQKIFLLVGPKRSGKGTIARVLTGVLGRHNVAGPTLASLATNFGLQDLIAKPLAIVSDARLSTRADGAVVVERLLSISGEDSLTVDRKYKDHWTGKLPTRFVILTNELPRLADASGALSGRFVLLTLTTSFYGREDPNLTNELLQEAPAILNWALEGLDRLQERGYFQMPKSSAEVIRQMEDVASPVGAFIRTRCKLGPQYEVDKDRLWAAWKDFCADQNRSVGTKDHFGRDLMAAAPMVKPSRPRRADGSRYQAYTGIDVGHPDHPDQDEDEASSGQGGHTDLPLIYPQIQEESDERTARENHGDSSLPGLREDRDLQEDEGMAARLPVRRGRSAPSLSIEAEGGEHIAEEIDPFEIRKCQSCGRQVAGADLCFDCQEEEGL
jgi:putative DNA primase/helicase